MGFRFRKSFKIAPGVRVNFGKKSVGVSIGNKGGGMSFNSKSGARVRASIPGTGLSYSSKLGGSKKRRSKRRKASSTVTGGYSAKVAPIDTNSYSTVASTGRYKPACLRWWYFGIIAIFAIGGFGNLGVDTGATIVGIAGAAIMGFFSIRAARKIKSVAPEEDIAAAQELSKRDELLALQKIVLEDSPEELIMPEWQLREMADEKTRNSHRIMNDCSTILRTTVNPDVFFDRLQLLSTHCRVLADLEKYIPFSGASPTDVLNTLVNEKQDIIREFLVRCFQSADAKADTLKTSRGKLNQYQRLYDSLIPYFAEMDTGNIDFVETTRQEKMKVLVETP